MEAQFSRDSASRSWQAGAPRFILAVSSTPGHIVVRALKEVVSHPSLSCAFLKSSSPQTAWAHTSPTLTPNNLHLRTCIRKSNEEPQPGRL